MSKPEQQWKVGMIGPGGQVITHIHGYSTKQGVMVFENQPGVARYWLHADQATAMQRRAISRHTNLELMLRDLFRGDALGALLDELGSALFTSLCSESDGEHDAAFRAIEERVRGRAVYPYFGGALVAALVLISACSVGFYLSPQEYAPYPLFLAAGTLGGLASVFNQLKLLNPGSIFDVRSVFLFGMVRVTLGALLTIFFVVAAKANLLLGIATSNNWAFAAFSFFSGFSERWVIDQMERLGTAKRKGKVQ